MSIYVHRVVSKHVLVEIEDKVVPVFEIKFLGKETGEWANEDLDNARLRADNHFCKANRTPEYGVDDFTIDGQPRQVETREGAAVFKLNGRMAVHEMDGWEYIGRLHKSGKGYSFTDKKFDKKRVSNDDTNKEIDFSDLFPSFSKIGGQQ